MENLSLKIKLYLEKNSKNYNNERNNFELQNNTCISFISSWNVSGVSKPTDEQLNAFESEATKLENNAIAVSNRQKEYGTVAKQIEFITEKGLEAWKTNVQAIKTKYPKE